MKRLAVALTLCLLPSIGSPAAGLPGMQVSAGDSPTSTDASPKDLSRPVVRALPLGYTLASDRSVLQDADGHQYPNARCKVAGNDPNDPLFPYQSHLDAHHVTDAWALQENADGVLIAILDTGAAYENYQDPGDDEEEGEDDDSDGGRNYRVASDLIGTSIIPGYDFVNHDDHPNDDHHHGTFVAGIVAQATNNAMGTAGLAVGATIMPIKVLDANGQGSLANVIAGIVYAADHGADIILMSFAFPAGVDPGKPLDDALEYAASQGVLLVAASGNQGTAITSYPAASPFCIAVGAARSDDSGVPVRTRYSNFGTAVDVMAFGGDAADRNADGQPDAPLAQAFMTGDPESEAYYFVAGTSSAAANAAGTLALLLAAGASPEEATAALLDTAGDMELPGFDTATGFGLMDPQAALQSVVAGTAEPASYDFDIHLRLERKHNKARLKAKITVHNDDGSPAKNVRVYVHFRGRFAAMSADKKTDGKGRAKIKSAWLKGVDPDDWEEGIDYGISLDHTVSSANRFDPNSLAPIDRYPGTNIIIDNPIKPN